MSQRYHLDGLLQPAYTRYPEGRLRPVIGVTANYRDGQACLSEGYYKQVEAAGGTPLLLPPTTDVDVLIEQLGHIDGLLLSGGADINPLFFGEEPLRALGGICPERDAAELMLTRLAEQRCLPILGICRGIQTLVAALGGRVAQDIYTDAPHLLKHSQEAPRGEATHSVRVEAGSVLYSLYQGHGGGAARGDGDAADLRLLVNSFHHQAVTEAGPRLRVVATAPDGVVEAVESRCHKALLGVQWHPECMGDEGMPLFRWLVEEAGLHREACRLHGRMLTLDTHCDTPMFFPQGIDFLQRDPRLCTDLHKMDDGRLDATIMVAYIPQQDPLPLLQGDTPLQPFDYANAVFDEIERTVARCPERLALARTPAQLAANKAAGRHSIMLGIENGRALTDGLHGAWAAPARNASPSAGTQDDVQRAISALQHFHSRGIVYVTLCHNGDNRLCDSAARSEQTHGGLSPLGRELVAEMNRLGVMVDLSHAAETTFYDAIEASTQPIVCSHSSARALCDHPRNLTDAQMLRLAQTGGVAQTTLYHGFLRKAGEADILDAMQHLQHAVDVMGIEHVGLGTDFDGDGGVPGMQNAADALNFTRHLLLRRFSEEDIRLIWGGNFLRLMAQIQQV